jgi:hypothetical protein
LPVIFYGCEIGFLTLQEEFGVTFEDRVLKRIFGPKRVAGTGIWKRWHIHEYTFGTIHQIVLW